MANVDSPFGLRPVRYKSGAPYNGAANPYYIASGYGTALFVGDPVIKVAGGSNTAAVTVAGVGSFQIGTLPNVEKSGIGDGNRITGVIVGFAPDPNNLSRLHNPASTERVAYVADDPSLIFEIQANGPIPAADMGFNAIMINTHSGSTVTGYSGIELDTTGTAPSADASNPLLIIKAVNRPDNDTTLIHAKVEVMINQHTENQGTVGTLGI